MLDSAKHKTLRLLFSLTAITHISWHIINLSLQCRACGLKFLLNVLYYMVLHCSTRLAFEKESCTYPSLSLCRKKVVPSIPVLRRHNGSHTGGFVSDILVCIVVLLCVFVVSYVYLLYLMCIRCILCVFVVSYVYSLYLTCICCILCVFFVLMCICCTSYVYFLYLCVFVVLCVLLFLLFRCRTAG
jgi:hypothetical protein